MSTSAIVQQLAELQRRVTNLEERLTRKSLLSWKQIIGASKGQGLDREAAKLGAAWRAKENKRK